MAWLAVLGGVSIGLLFTLGGTPVLQWGRFLVGVAVVGVWTLLLGLMDNQHIARENPWCGCQVGLLGAVPLLVLLGLIGNGSLMTWLGWGGAALWFLILGRGQYLSARQN